MRAILGGRSSPQVLYGLRPEASYMSDILCMGLLHALYGCDRRTRAFRRLFKDKTPVIMRRTKGRARVPQHFSQDSVPKIAILWLASLSEPSIATSEQLQTAFRRKESFPLYEQVLVMIASSGREAGCLLAPRRCGSLLQLHRLKESPDCGIPTNARRQGEDAKHALSGEAWASHCEMSASHDRLGSASH